jgi:hypothetical protein
VSWDGLQQATPNRSNDDELPANYRFITYRETAQRRHLTFPRLEYPSQTRLPAPG